MCIKSRKIFYFLFVFVSFFSAMQITRKPNKHFPFLLRVILLLACPLIMSGSSYITWVIPVVQHTLKNQWNPWALIHTHSCPWQIYVLWWLLETDTQCLIHECLHSPHAILCMGWKTCDKFSFTPAFSTYSRCEFQFSTHVWTFQGLCVW